MKLKGTARFFRKYEDEKPTLKVKKVNMLLNEFKNPGPAWRGKPFWSWNGTLQKDELLRQIDVMKQMGLGGYFMHSRTGLKTEYLGDEWFDLINACTEKGTDLEMESWIYDEDRWPSGTCGGIVTEKLENRARFIRGQVYTWEEYADNPQAAQTYGGEQFEQTVAVFYARLDGFKLYEYEKVELGTKGGDLPAKADGFCFVVFTIERFTPSSFYNGNTWVDTLNPKATQDFIDSTYERYKDKSGKYFGDGIRGVFTDEPNRGTVFDVFANRAEKQDWLTPFTPELFNEFEKLWGHRLEQRLPELFFWKDGIKLQRIKWEYMELLQQLFLDNFAKPLYMWCEENNLRMTGHILHEDSLAAQTGVSGSVMRYYEHMHDPGIDILKEDGSKYHVVKQLSSAARQNGQKWLLSELYGCTGWQMGFEGHKWVGDWQALFGINLRCHHLSWYNMEGESKRDFPGSILHQSAWYKDYGVVETYFARMGYLLSQGSPVCDVLVMNPVESIWSKIYPGATNYLTAIDADMQQTEQRYTQLFSWLVGNHIDFDYGDEDMVARMYKVDSSGDTPLLHVGKAAYKTVVVGGMDTIRQSTLDVLNEFLSVGGKVIFAGDLPSHVDALPAANKLEKTVTGSITTGWDEHQIVQQVGSAGIGLHTCDGQNMPMLLAQQRADDDCEYIVVVNTDRDNAYDNVVLDLDKKYYQVQELDLLSGSVYDVPTDGNGNVVTRFDKAGSRAFVLHKGGQTVLPSSTPPVCFDVSGATGQALAGPFEYSLDEPNVCVLDEVEYSIDGSNWIKDDVLRADRAVRKHFGIQHRSGEMVQPWYQKKFFGESACKTLGKISLRYSFTVDQLPSQDVVLCVEEAQKFSICLNGTQLKYNPDDGFWIDIAFKKIRVDKTLLQSGDNTIELTTDFNALSNLEAVYLVGDFGVYLDGTIRIIRDLPQTLSIGDISVQGLPFYGADLNYEIELAEESNYLDVPNFDGAFIALRTENGREIRPWAPYGFSLEGKSGKARLEVMLTRRNTFGPLHQIPLHTEWYAPRSFVSEGEAWQDAPNLWPNGLLASPIVY